MAIMTRIIRLCKADLHAVLDSIEDQGLLLKQYLRDMEDALRRKKAQLGASDRTALRLRAELETTQGETDRIEADLAQVLATGKDAGARMLVRKILRLNRRGEFIARQIKELERIRGESHQRLVAQERQYHHLQQRASAYLQRGERPRGDSASPPADGCGVDAEPSETEIDLELLRRRGMTCP